MRFLGRSTDLRATLLPSERARLMICRWKWVQITASLINVIIMAGLAGYIVSKDVDIAGGVIVPIIMVRMLHAHSRKCWTDAARLASRSCSPASCTSSAST